MRIASAAHYSTGSIGQLIKGSQAEEALSVLIDLLAAGLGHLTEEVGSEEVSVLAEGAAIVIVSLAVGDRVDLHFG